MSFDLQKECAAIADESYSKKLMRPTPPLLILNRGLPGSGKNTLAYQIWLSIIPAKRIETNDFFYKPAPVGKVFEFDKVKLTEYHARCLTKALCLLADGISVIVSNSFIMRWEMQRYINIGTDLGAKCIIINNRAQFSSPHFTETEEKMQAMRAKWQEVLPDGRVSAILDYNASQHKAEHFISHLHKVIKQETTPARPAAQESGNQLAWSKSNE